MEIKKYMIYSITIRNKKYGLSTFSNKKDI
ncbi:hypothetical protein CK5_15860 [Blautia obeum A2-162]|uniref:Uncharacterized protein n=1 Tax=Blautia obeum A2-162 TaxID=657314 RepID=D4LQE3_9FIRM|nr:hypothetical protein CK5_15860 [Blautia obeum A2-162]